jgi:ribosome-associated protein YbcJ (S4-like RNA binding protein)
VYDFPSSRTTSPGFNGEVELRRGRQLKPGDVVRLDGKSYTV